MDSYDVAIVGAGPAGLSAALVLGRCLRNVIICDSGSPRNATSHALHAFLTRDGIKPSEFLNIGREQLSIYKNVRYRSIEVVDAAHSERGFTLKLSDSSTISCTKLLLATGVKDILPEIDGITPLYGTSVFHCPYCDGWEMRNKNLAVYGPKETGIGLALELTLWSKHVVLCTDNRWNPSTENRQRLDRHKIALREERIVRFTESAGALKQVEFTDGAPLNCDGLFFSTGNYQRSPLAERLGCEFTDEGAVKTGDYETTNIPGLYVAGDASRLVQLAIVAAAEGAKAAFAINQELLKAELAMSDKL